MKFKFIFVFKSEFCIYFINGKCSDSSTVYLILQKVYCIQKIEIIIAILFDYLIIKIIEIITMFI